MIDLRSDTVTKPTNAMRAAMAAAEVGDDVYGEDPTVNRLEHLGATISGKEAAIFCASGTQGNLLALLCHCQRGDEYIVGQQAHTYLYEGGGAAVLGSIQPQPLNFEADGTLDLEKVATLVKPNDFHFARTRLLCLENTQGGRSLPLAYLHAARACADRHGLTLHLDGARIFNAAIASNTAMAEIAAPFDSISFCLSKGLGAPLGTLLAGPADFVREARRWRKVLGGGMRQAGIVAAAGIHALEHHVERLAEDHSNAARLAAGLADIEEIKITGCHTNMVFADMASTAIVPLQAFLRERGILVGGRRNTLRLVTHLDIGKADVDTAVAAFRDFYGA
jgi:threonine aldolase